MQSATVEVSDKELESAAGGWGEAGLHLSLRIIERIISTRDMAH